MAPSRSFATAAFQIAPRRQNGHGHGGWLAPRRFFVERRRPGVGFLCLFLFSSLLFFVFFLFFLLGVCVVVMFVLVGVLFFVLRGRYPALGPSLPAVELGQQKAGTPLPWILAFLVPSMSRWANLFQGSSSLGKFMMAGSTASGFRTVGLFALHHRARLRKVVTLFTICRWTFFCLSGT